MLVYLCPLSLFAQFVPVRSLRLYVPFISGGQTREMTQCWANVGPPSTELPQHYPSIGLPFCVWRHAECGPASQTAGQH